MNSRTAGRMRGLLFILPSLLGVGVFVLAPFLEVVRRSFTGAMNGVFVGLKNYADVFSNGAFRLAAGNTLRFVAFCMPLLISLSLLVAVILYGNPRRAGFFKTTFLIPMAIPVASIVLIWKALFHADGLVNSWITALGGQGTDWMQSSAAFWVLVGATSGRTSATTSSSGWPGSRTSRPTSTRRPRSTGRAHGRPSRG